MMRWFVPTVILALGLAAERAEAEPMRQQVSEVIPPIKPVADALSDLEEKGLSLGLQYYAEVWGNTSGGLRTGAVYTGLGEMELEWDLEKGIGWEGASFYTRWLWISGRDASEDLVGNMFTISNVAAFNTFRSAEIWLQQDLWNDRLSLRLGQLVADTEFTVSEYGCLFLNATFGWSAFIYMNLENGGPGYPMGVPGIRLATQPTEGLAFLTAVYQGNVYAQDVNRHGFRWRLNADQGFFWMAELQCTPNQLLDTGWLPATYKVGAWFDTASGIPSPDLDKTYWGNYGVYLVVDQMLYREPQISDFSKSQAAPAGPPSLDEQGLGVFARAAFSPADRNFLQFYFDTGITYTGLIPGRDSDQVGFALGFAQLSPGAVTDLEDAGGRDAGYEMVLEMTYAAMITPWLSVQPDFQYIVHPGGDRTLQNAFVVGGRVTITF